MGVAALPMVYKSFSAVLVRVQSLRRSLLTHFWVVLSEQNCSVVKPAKHQPKQRFLRLPSLVTFNCQCGEEIKLILPMTLD